LLRSVVEEGTGTRAKSLKRPLAGKTGTTNKAKDAWFVGYSTDIVTAVWVGYDDAIPLGGGEAGSVTALPAWISFMRAAHEKKAGTDFPRPTSIIVARIDPATGLLAYADQEDAIEEEFLDGTVPTQVAEPIKNPNIEETQPTEDPEATAPAEAPEALPERPSVQQPKPEADEPTTEPPPF
jgi:penicillin-binding protein 1A